MGKTTRDVRRECSRCHQDQTPLRRGIYEVRNSRGYGVGLFCEDCVPKVRDLVDAIACCHGAHVVDGRYLSSPRGTPDLRSVEALEGYLAERRVNT